VDGATVGRPVGSVPGVVCWPVCGASFNVTPFTHGDMAVLVAYDGSEPAVKAVEHAAAEHDEELVLLRVTETADSSLEAGIELAQDALSDDDETDVLSEEVRDRLASDAVSYRVERVLGDPTEKIAAVAGREEIDHVVVGSHGRTGVSRVLLGSVAESVVRHAPVPVTVVR